MERQALSHHYFVFSEIKEKITKLLQKKREVKPLVSTKSDLDLVRKVKGKKFPGLKQLSLVKRILSPLEKKIVRLCIFVIAIGFIFFVFSVIVRNSREVPAVGGRYTEAVVGAPSLINPIFASINDVDTDLSKLVFSGLMKYNKEQELVPDLAESYEVGEDKKTYTFKLRQDVIWHDGNKFTGKDVVFTIETIQNKEVGSPLLVSFQGLDVKLIDDYTVVFRLQEPFAPFLSTLTVGIISEDIWFDVLPDRMRLHGNNLQPVGTGPFVFKKLSKDDSGYIRNFELGRFKNYYNSPPYIEEFVFKFYAEYEGPDGAIQALRGQRVQGLNFVPHDLKDKVQRKHINLHILQLPQYTALFFNQDKNSNLKESKMRTALQIAIDKDRILREALRNEGKVIESPILSGFPGYNPEIEKIKYDVTKANELLDTLWDRLPAEEYLQKKRADLIKEWRDNNTTSSTTSTMDVSAESGTGTSTISDSARENIETQLRETINEAQVFYRKDDNSEIIEIDLVTVDTQEYKQVADFIAGFWQEVGIKTNISFVSLKEFTRAALKNRDYDVLLYGMILGSDPDQYSFWHSSQALFPGLNLSQYINRNVDALLESAREIDNEEEIIELYKKFQDIILSEKPAIFLYMPTYTYATTDEVNGIDVVRIFHPVDRFVNVTEWYMKTKREWGK
ncbi:MAG: ABC transporter substrate-binding protein [bacterium]|nr:ABC transporter substrate-binding protein [bacterium]